MGAKCAFPHCKSGYKSTSSTKTVPIPLHRFPSREKYPKIFELWKKKIARDRPGHKKWDPNAHHRVCGLHFSESDYFPDSQDSNLRRKRRKGDTELTRARLRPEAYPNKNLREEGAEETPMQQHTSPKKRRRDATTDGRLLKENVRLDDLFDRREAEEDLLHGDLEALECRLRTETNVPADFCFCRSVLFF
jgi:hypothetical protein